MLYLYTTCSTHVGIGINLEGLLPFVDALEPTIEVLRFDVPGTTSSSPVPLIPYRFSAHAQLVTRMLDHLGYLLHDERMQAFSRRPFWQR